MQCEPNPAFFSILVLYTHRDTSLDLFVSLQKYTVLNKLLLYLANREQCLGVSLVCLLSWYYQVTLTVIVLEYNFQYISSIYFLRKIICQNLFPRESMFSKYYINKKNSTGVSKMFFVFCFSLAGKLFFGCYRSTKDVESSSSEHQAIYFISQFKNFAWTSPFF